MRPAPATTKRHDVVQASIITDTDAVPRHLVEQAQADIRSHIVGRLHR